MKAKSSKKSRGKSATPATPVALFGGSLTGKTEALPPSKLSFRALNDIYIIEEDPIQTTDTGLSGEVEAAIKESRLVIPDAYQDFTQKFPCTGVVISKGQQTKSEEVQVGTRVMFARLGVQRYKIAGRNLCNCLESDLHAILD